MTDKSRRRRLTAMGLLAAFVLPGAAVLLLAAHELLEHDHHHAEEAWASNPWHSPIVRIVLEHGHSHEAGAPAHDHDAVRRAEREASTAHGLLASLPLSRSPAPGLKAPDRPGRPGARPEAAARGTPQSLSLLCVLLI